MLTERVQRWRQAGAIEDVLGRQLFVHRRPGNEDPLLLFLHGFPSSSYDWRELFELRQGRATLAFDFLGFGLSEKPRDHLYTLAWQANPTLGQRLLRSPLGPLFARLTTERSFRAQFSRVFSPDHPLSPEEAADQWSLIAQSEGQRIAHRTIHYMDERERLTDRWHSAIRDWPGSLTLAWGLRDPVARTEVLDGLRALRPGVETIELPDAGHYPQIERPDLISAALGRALEASSS